MEKSEALKKINKNFKLKEKYELTEELEFYQSIYKRIEKRIELSSEIAYFDDWENEWKCQKIMEIFNNTIYWLDNFGNRGYKLEFEKEEISELLFRIENIKNKLQKGGDL